MCRPVLYVLINILVCVIADESGPLISTQQGILRGTYGTSAGGRTYTAFQGIPFAEPRVGKDRFKESKIAKPWRGVRNAVNTSQCIQYTPTGEGGTVIGTEDCLHLNVFTPVVNTTSLLDVIVFIYGGAFMMGGSSSYGPKYLMDRDVVYVSINYRLGVIGFLSTEDKVVPGNNGLKDQVLALKWVQKNIAAFKGDPKRVTITGNSAGGASVQLHYLSPLSKGLFHRGISSSGTSLNSWSQAEDLQEKGKMVGSLLGCPTNSSKKLVRCLKHRPAKDIVENVKYFVVLNDFPISPWGPIVEKNHSGAFLSEQPIDILKEGRAQPLPWLTGVNTEEGLDLMALFLAKPNLTTELAARWDDLAPLIMDWNLTVALDQRHLVAQRVKHFYLGGKPISSDTSAELIQMFSDRFIVVDAERAARIHAYHNAGPVFFYRFGYRGKHSLSEVITGEDINWGVCHTDDINYVFNSTFKTNETENDRAMVRVMVDMWVNFATTGNPAPSHVVWEPLSPNYQEEMPYMWLGNASDIEMRSTLDLGHRDFWDSLPIIEPQVIWGRLPDTT